MPGQPMPPLVERDRIARGLITRLDDVPKAAEPGAAEQEEVLELLVPFGTLCLTFTLARLERPPKLELVDFARIAVAQRMLNALPVSFGLIRRHLYVEAIAASRPLLEGALLLNCFLKRPERAGDWFEDPGTFIHLGKLRKELGEEARDSQYSWSSEYGEHVTAAGFRLIAGVDDEQKRATFSIGGRFDASLQTMTSAVLLMSAGEASGAMGNTFLHDTVRLPSRGQGAFVQLMKAGLLDRSRRNAIEFATRLGSEGPQAKQLLSELDDAAEAYAEEAAKLESAGLIVPALSAEF